MIENMKATKRFLLTLAAVLGMMGAWAEGTDEVTVTQTANNNEWTLQMPASDVELEVVYYTEEELDQEAADAVVTLFDALPGHHRG